MSAQRSGIPSNSPRKYLNPALLVFGGLLLLIGLALAAGGVQLAVLGGSWYYLITGLALAVSGLLYLWRKPAAAWLYASVFIGTVLWALCEVGLNFRPLVPRLAPVLVLALFASLLLPALRGGEGRGVSRALSAVFALILLAGGGAMLVPHGVIRGTHIVGSVYPMEGTPFMVNHASLSSPLGIPCHAPPWGTFDDRSQHSQSGLAASRRHGQGR